MARAWDNRVKILTLGVASLAVILAFIQPYNPFSPSPGVDGAPPQDMVASLSMAVDPAVRLRHICRLIEALRQLERVPAIVVMMDIAAEMPAQAENSNGGLGAKARRADEYVPWPLLPHELLGFDFHMLDRLEDSTRKRALENAWAARFATRANNGASDKAENSRPRKVGVVASLWDMMMKEGKKDNGGGDEEDIRNELLELGAWAADILSDPGVWKVYGKRIVGPLRKGRELTGGSSGLLRGEEREAALGKVCPAASKTNAQ